MKRIVARVSAECSERGSTETALGAAKGRGNIRANEAAEVYDEKMHGKGVDTTAERCDASNASMNARYTSPAASTVT